MVSKNLVNFKYMLAIIGLIYEFADTSWKTSLSKELKFERFFFFQLPQSNSKIKLFVAEKEKSLTLKVFSQKSSLFLWLQVTSARKFIRKIGPRNCFPIWLHPVAFTCLGEFIKEGSVKMQVCGKKRFSNTHVWTINFFFFFFFFLQGKFVLPLSKLSLKYIALMALLTTITYMFYIRKLLNWACMRWWTFENIRVSSTQLFIAQLNRSL